MKWHGRLFLLKLKVDGYYQTIAAQRVTSGSLTNESIDASDKDSPWRALIEGGTRALDVSASGLINDEASFKRLVALAASGEAAEVLFQFWAGESLELRMQVAQFEGSGPFDAAQQYAVSFVSADDATAPVPIYFTSPPYPVAVIEGLDAPHLDNLRVFPSTGYPEAMDAGHLSFNFATLRDPLVPYEMTAEGMDAPHLSLTSAILRDLFQAYDIGVEALDAPHLTLQSVTLREALVPYSHWPAEALDAPHLTLNSASLI